MLCRVRRKADIPLVVELNRSVYRMKENTVSVINPPVEYKDPFENIITLKESGQIQQYGDSRWSGTVLIKRESLNHDDMVRSLIESKVQNGHIFTKGVQRPFAAPYFTVMEQDSKEPLLWKFVVMRDYLD